MSQEVVTELVIDASGAQRGAAQFNAAMDSVEAAAAKTVGTVQNAAASIVIGFGGIIAAAAGLRAFIDYTGNINAKFAAIGESARNAGLSVREFQETLYAAKVSGLSDKDFVSGIDRIGADLLQASRGATEFGRLFEANGLKIRGVNGDLISTKEALAGIANLVRNAPTPQVEQAMVRIVGLSKDWIPFLRQGSDAIESVKARAMEVGAVVDDDVIAKARDFDREWKAAVAAWDQQFKSSLSSILPLLVKLANIASVVLDKAGEIGGYFSRKLTPVDDMGLRDLEVQLSDLKALRDLMKDVGPEIDQWTQFRMGQKRGGLGLDPDSGLADVDKEIAHVNDLIKRRKELAGLPRVTVFGDGSSQLPAIEAEKSAFDRAADAVVKHTARMEADAKAVGLGVGAQEQFRAESALTLAALQAGIPITQALADRIQDLAQDAGDAAAALAQKQAQDKAGFDLQTAGLSAVEQQIAQLQYRLHGNDWQAFMNDGLAATMRLTDAIKQMADAERQAFTSLIGDLSSGRTGMEALANATTGLLKKFSDIGANQVFDVLTGKSGALSLSGTFSFDTKAVQTAVQRGTIAGFDAIQANAAAMAKNSPSVGGINLGTGGGAIGAGLAGAGALAGAYFNGQKTTDTGTAAATGALSGGLAGLAIGGPIGAVIGGIGGAILSFFGANSAKKEEDKKNAEAWKAALPAEQAFIATLNGHGAGSLTSAFAQSKAQVDQYILAAEKAKDTAAPGQLLEAFNTSVYHQVNEFKTNFEGMLAALDSGLGFNSPIIQAQQNVKSIGDQLKAFVDDTDTSNRVDVLAKFYGEPGSPQVAAADGVGPLVQAMQAAQNYALSLLQSVPVLSETQKAIQSIDGTADQLRTTLVDLGMSSLDAAYRIDQGVKKAMDALAANFSAGLTTRLNAALDKSYLNSATALIVQHQQDLADAAALGSNPALMAQVSAVFAAEAQKIVNDAGLVGDAFDDFTRQFPELASIVSDASASLAQSAEEQRKALNASAKSIVDYVNGLYAGSASTLSPQDRLAAAQSSYQTTLALAQAGNADAQGKITTDSQNLLDAARAMYGSTAAYQGIFQQITSQLLALPAVVQTTDPVVAAMRDAILAIKETTEAVNGTTTSIGVMQSQLIAALALNSPSMIAGAFLQSGATGLTYAQFVAGFPAGLATDSTLSGLYGAIDTNKNGIISQLELLQAALRPAIESGSAANIASALSTYFNALDANTDNTIDFNEMKAALAGMASDGALRDMFTRLDTDNSGSITKLELIRGATQGANDNTAYANSLQSSANGLAATANDLANTSNSLLNAIQGLQSTSKDQLALLNNQLTNAGASVSMGGYVGTADFAFTVTTSNNNLLTALNKIVMNTYAIAGNTYALVQNTTAKNLNHYMGVLAGGGWITGGVPGVDSVLLASGQHLGMPGEFVVRHDVAQANKAWLPSFNETGRLPSFGAPAAMSRAGNDNGDIRALMAEVKALREAVARMDANNVKVTAASAEAGARHVREGIDANTEVQVDTNKRVRRA